MAQALGVYDGRVARSEGMRITSVLTVTIDVGIGDSDRDEHLTVAQFYGDLSEGLEYHPGMTVEQHEALRTRYLRRLALANLASVPDGSRIVLSINGRPLSYFVLWSPSYLVQVRSQEAVDRIERNVERDGSFTLFSSEAEWQAHLRNSGLPDWFFSADHINMQVNHIEARHLGITSEVLTHFLTPYRQARGGGVLGRNGARDFAVVQEQDESVGSAVYRACEQGYYLFPPTMFSGIGGWHWLTREDRRRAEYLGYASPLQAFVDYNATHNIELRRQIPSFLWRPFNAGIFHNPPIQPSALGHWEFVTFVDEDMAAVDLGGDSQPWGLPDRPNADQVAFLRESFQAQDMLDMTINVNLVWIPRLAWGMAPGHFSRVTLPFVDGVQRLAGKGEQSTVLHAQLEDAKAKVKAEKNKRRVLRLSVARPIAQSILDAIEEAIVVAEATDGNSIDASDGMAAIPAVEPAVIDSLVDVDDEEEEATAPDAFTISEELAAEQDGHYGRDKEAAGSEQTDGEAEAPAKGSSKRARSADRDTPSPSKRVRFSSM